MEALKRLGESLLSVAPTIAGALVPGGGVLAGAAVQAVGAALGIEKPTPDAVKKALDEGLSPDQLLAIRKADQDFATRMKELDVDVTRIHQADRKDARRMQVRTKSFVTGAIAITVTLATLSFFGYVAHEAFTPEPHGPQADPAMMQLVALLVGNLTGAFTTILAFYYGSSEQGGDEAQHMADAASRK